MDNTFEGWDNPDSAEDFFSDDFNSGDEDIIKEALKEEDEDDLKGGHTKTEEVEEGIDLFAGDPDYSTEDISKDDLDEEGSQKPSGSNLSLYSTLKEKGFVNLDPEEGEDLTEELAEELIEEGLESFVDDKIRQKLNSLPRDVQGLIQYTLSGGDMRGYLDSMGSMAGSGLDDVDFDNEEHQEYVTRTILAEEGNDGETIEAQIEFLKDSGKLKGFAENKHKIWNEKKTKREEAVLRQREIEIREAKKKIKERKQEFTDYLTETDNIKGITIPRKLKKEIPDYLEERNVPLKDGSFITGLQRDLFYELPKNKEALMQLAVMMKNRNEDGTFNFKSIAENIQTEVVREIKRDVRRGKPILPSSSDRTVKMDRPLADYF